MAQFTVYRNKNPRSKATFPLLVDVQSDLLDDLHESSFHSAKRRPWPKSQ